MKVSKFLFLSVLLVSLALVALASPVSVLDPPGDILIFRRTRVVDFVEAREKHIGCSHVKVYPVIIRSNWQGGGGGGGGGKGGGGGGGGDT